MRVKRPRGRALRERRGVLPPTENFLRMALPALVLGVLWLFVVTLVTWVIHCCVRVITFHYKLYKLEAVVQNDAPPLPPPPGPKSAAPPPPPQLQSLCYNIKHK